MRKFALYIAITLLLLTGCERQEDVEMKVPFKRKLVTAVFVAAGDSLVKASLSYSTPVFGSTPILDIQYATSANAVLFCNGAPSNFKFDSATKEYYAFTAPHYAVAGDSYKIMITDDQESVFGTTIIPSPVDLDFKLKFDSAGDNPILPLYRAELTYTLKGTSPAYVKILPILMLDDSFSISVMTPEIFKPMVLMNAGESITTQFLANSSVNGLYPLNLRCLIISCDEAYAKYSNATQGIDFGTVFPGSEPSFVYSNMSNRVGIIASYNICGEKVFHLK
jgi:Domain of unknown function (DUF4249)